MSERKGSKREKHSPNLGICQKCSNRLGFVGKWRKWEEWAWEKVRGGRWSAGEGEIDVLERKWVPLWCCNGLYTWYIEWISSWDPFYFLHIHLWNLTLYLCMWLFSLTFDHLMSLENTKIGNFDALTCGTLGWKLGNLVLITFERHNIR